MVLSPQLVYSQVRVLQVRLGSSFYLLSHLANQKNFMLAKEPNPCQEGFSFVQFPDFRYFRMMTIWYLHYHRTWDSLCHSCIGSSSSSSKLISAGQEPISFHSRSVEPIRFLHRKRSVYSAPTPSKRQPPVYPSSLTQASFQPNRT